MMQINRFFAIVASILCLSGTLSAQLVSSPFGQNRIQYEKYKWMRYETPNFAFSFTEENEDLMRFLVPVAEANYAELKSILEYQVRQKVELIIYTDFSDFAQSNVGLTSPAVNTGGKTKLLDNKILIYFDGNHQNLTKLLREGIARSLVNRMLFGSNLQEVVQNSVLLNLPQWFSEGLIAYCVEEWSPEADDELREAIFSKKYSNYLDLAKQKPVLAGRSLFHYIARNHGTASISNLLYLTRINRSVESGFLYVFGTSFYTIAGSNWHNYFNNRYNDDNKNRFFPNAGEAKINHRKNSIIKELSLSPNGKFIAYTEHNQGEYWVVLYNVADSSQQTIWKGGVRDLTEDVDANYPLLAWRKNSSQLVVVNEKADKVFVNYLSIEKPKAKGESKQIKGLERVLSVAVLNNDELLLTGIKGGYSDLFIYKGGEVKALTNDKWDDLDATAVELGGRAGIVFASNRPENLLKTAKSEAQPDGQLDLFYYELNSKDGQLVKLTNTPLSSERAPQSLSEQLFTYLSSENGISNRFIGRLDTVVDYYQQVVVFKDGSTVTLPKDSVLAEGTVGVDSTYQQAVYRIKGDVYANTDYSRNIIEHSMGSSKKVADMLYRDGQYRIFIRELRTERSASPEKTKYRLVMERQAGLLSDVDKEKTKNKKTQKMEKKPEPSNENDKELAKELELVKSEIDSTKAITKDSLPPNKKISDTTKVDIDNYLFQSEFQDVQQPVVKDPAKPKSDTLIKPIILEEGDNGEITKKEPTVINKNLTKNIPKPVLYDPERKTKYRNMFKVDELTFQLDNTPMFWGMDLYLNGYYRFQPLSLLFKTSFTDIFEDYRLEVGIRMPVNFNGMEYFVSFEDRKHRLDKKFSVYRRGRLDNYEIVDTLTNDTWEVRGRNIKYMAMAEFRYPLSKFSSVQGTLSFQSDKVAIISEDRNSLNVPLFSFSQAGLRAEYIYDNTIPLRLNARKGTRARFFADYFQNIQTEADSLKYNLKVLSPTMVLGFDARHYFSFDNKTIFAFRSTAAASFGKMKMLYALGGMENWVLPSANENIPLPDASNFTYQVLAAPLRGFQNNIRNGSNFAVINAEVRIPITEYLSRTPPSNVLLRNLQLVGFYDVGTAWQGLSPFSKENPLNTTTIDPGAGGSVVSPIRVRVNYYRRPIVQGAGFGLRTVFLGYFLRMDYAWGIETGALQTPRVYLSLGMDF